MTHRDAPAPRSCSSHYAVTTWRGAAQVRINSLHKLDERPLVSVGRRSGDESPTDSSGISWIARVLCFGMASTFSAFKVFYKKMRYISSCKFSALEVLDDYCAL